MKADAEAVALIRQLQDRLEYLLTCYFDNKEPDMSHVGPVLACVAQDAVMAEAFGQYDSWIGKVVTKRSGKPFKSGNQKATVTGIVFNEHSEKAAFTFEEDDICVDCFRCQLQSLEVCSICARSDSMVTLGVELLDGKIPSLFKKCSACGSEFADAEIMQINKQMNSLFNA